MLTLEIALLAGTAGVFVALLSCLLVLSTRRQMNRRLDEFKFELEVHLSANHELAKQLRVLQRNQAQPQTVAASESAERTQESKRAYNFEAPEAAAEPEPKPREAGLSLAEKLGLSQSEADIVTHLRPRKRGVRETA